MTAPGATTGRLGAGAVQGRPSAWWGTVLLVVTEGMLFALLLFVWFYLRSRTSPWPPEGVRDPELMTVSVRTGLLLASSATMSFADRGARHDRRGRLVVGVLATLALAAVFLAGHVHEMSKLIGEYTWADHAYGSARYVVLNFHAAHLIVGMIMLGFLLLAAARGRGGAGDHLSVQVTSMYWHFVDVVWAVVFVVLYVLPVVA